MNEPRPARRWIVFAGVPVLVAANIYLRHSLEHAGLYLYDFLPNWYPAGVRTVFSGHYPWWKFLLPIAEFQGSWTATTLLVTHVMTGWLGNAARVWYAYHALLIVVTFAASWVVYRSAAFSYTLALCLGFGTHLYHTYSVSGSIALVLLIVYYELLLLAAYEIVRTGSRRWWAAFVVAGVVTALAYEAWLDFVVFAGVAGGSLWLVFRRHGRVAEARRVFAVTAALAALAVAYVVVKTSVGFAQGNGSESDVVFNYPALAPKVEDLVSNAVTHLYISLTNYLPPVFLSSTALYELGGERLVAYQYGYHAAFSYLVPMHYLFLWRYAAGAAAVLFIEALILTGRALWQRLDADRVSLFVFLVMTAVGGPTHALVKARPMKTAPVLGYHTLVGVLGVSLLIAFAMMRIARDWRRPRAAALAIACTWAIVLYGALARPAMLDHLAAQVGLGEGQYPDPMRALAANLGLPLRRPGGSAAFPLEIPVGGRETPIGLASEGAGWLPPLAAAAPPPREWTPLAGVHVTPASDAVTVVGDASTAQKQLVSPAIPVRPHEKIALRVRMRVSQGRVCFGVLDAAQMHWLRPAVDVRQEHAADTGDNDRVWLVVANCNRRVTENDPSMFALYGVTYETAP